MHASNLDSHKIFLYYCGDHNDTPYTQQEKLRLSCKVREDHGFALTLDSNNQTSSGLL